MIELNLPGLGGLGFFLRLRMKIKPGQTQAYLVGCGVSAVPPNHVGLNLHYAKSIQEMAAIQAGRRHPRQLRIIVTKQAAAKIRDSISSGIIALDNINEL